MSLCKRNWIKANTITHLSWIRALPLDWQNWNLSSAEWRAAARRRLHLHVIPVERQCRFCKLHRCDVWGTHATSCSGGSSRKLRHNCVRDILARAIRDAGFRTGYEHGGGLYDDIRPGDVIVYNWEGDKHLLIDVAVTNPLCPSRIHITHENGVGGPAPKV